LIRSEAYGSAPFATSSVAASGNGFFSAINEMLCVFGILLVIAIGTTAPFSAMSGAVMAMSLLSIGLAAPRFLSASATALDSNPGLFQAADQA
jgi:hypothetical protein